MPTPEEIDQLLKAISPNPGKEIYKKLSSSIRGRIYFIKDTRDGKRYAVKAENLGNANRETKRNMKINLIRLKDFNQDYKKEDNRKVNIVQVVRHGVTKIDEESGKTLSWFMMEYSEDRSLDDPEGDKKIVKYTPEESIEIVRQMADGLEHVHKRRFAHRDLKPSNIIMFGARPTINDFEDLGSSGTRTTHTGDTIRGTPGYRAPEADIMAGERIKNLTAEEKAYFDKSKNEPALRSKPTLDIFPLGIVFTQMLTKLSHPLTKRFDIKSEDTARAQEKKSIDISEQEYMTTSCNTKKLEEHLWLASIGNVALETIIEKCIVYDSKKLDADRYQTIEEFAFDLNIVGRKDNRNNKMYYEYYQDIFDALNSIGLDADKLEEHFQKLSGGKKTVLAAYEQEKNDFLGKIARYEKEKGDEDAAAVRPRAEFEKFIKENNEMINKKPDECTTWEMRQEWDDCQDQYVEKEYELRRHEWASKEQLFGSVLEIVDGKKDSVLIEKLNKAIMDKYKKCTDEINENLATFEKIPGDLAEMVQEFVTDSLTKYEKFVALSRQYGLEVQQVAVTDSKQPSIDSRIGSLRTKYTGQSDIRVIASQIEDKQTAETKKQYYDGLLLKARGAMKELQTIFKNANLNAALKKYESKIEKQKSIIDRICEEAKQRAEEALDRYCSEKYKKDASYAKLAFEFDRYQPEVPQDKIDLAKELGKDNHPVYTGFAEVKQASGRIDECEAVMQEIKKDMGRG
jgi:serine/threonine protein kinase/ribosomal protein L31